MDFGHIVLLILVPVLIIIIFQAINPKLDWNDKTNERILWFNNPFNIYDRGFIILSWWKRNNL